MNWFSRLFGGKKESATARTIIGLNPYKATFADDRYETFAREGYQYNPYVFKCIEQLGSAVSGIDWELFQKRGKEKTALTEHPYLKLINNPNPLQSKSSLFKASTGYYHINGNMYFEQVGPDNRPPRELYIHRPDRVTIRVGNPQVPILGYEYQASSTVLIPPEKLLHIKSFNPLNDWYGMSPLKAAALSVDQNNHSKKWNVSLLQNGAKISLSVSTDGELTEPEYKRLEAAIKEKYGGAENAGGILLLEGGLKQGQMSWSPHDMDWMLGQKLSAREICVVMGVPPELVGDSENKTYSNYKEARKAFYEETILPLMDFMRDEFNRWLTPQFGDNLYLDYDRDDIEALQEDRTAVWDRATKAFNDTLLTRKEARELLGYPTTDADAVYKSGLATILTPADEVLESATKAAAGGGEAKGKKKLTAAQKQAFWRAINETQVLREMETERAVRKYFTKQERNILDGLLRLAEEKSALLTREHKEKRKLVDEVADWESEQQALQKLLKNQKLQAAEAGSAKVNEIFSLGVDFDLIRAEMLAKVEAIGGEKIRENIQSITETTKKQLQASLTEGIEAGESVPDLAKRVRETFDGIKRDRSATIARTETHNSVGAGTYETYKVAEVGKKEWLSTGDDRTRDSHDAINGEVREMDEAFSNGLMFPGDDGPEEEVINCRCTLLPVIE